MYCAVRSSSCCRGNRKSFSQHNTLTNCGRHRKEQTMPHNMGEYYERVSDYELEYQSQTEQDVPFWCELVMRYTPQRVLELACGSGRIGIELLHCPGNFQLEGLDISPEML